MPTKRELTAAVCSGKALVVAEGEGEEYTKLTTVEVMDTDTLQWSTASSLLHPLSLASATVCGDSVYLASGWDNYGPMKSVFMCSLSDFLQLQTGHPVWHSIADLPVECSTCATLNGWLIAVGGAPEKATICDDVYSYNPESDSWEVISHMPTPQRSCLETVLPGNKLMHGGWKVDWW